MRSSSLAFLCICLTAITAGCSSPPKPTPCPAASPTALPVPPGKLAPTEFAMTPGETIVVRTSVGTMRIAADDWLKRSYTWEGATRSVTLWPRNERWYGSLGMYYPGPGSHWKEHNGITRCVVEEGQQHFASEDEAMTWLNQHQWMPFVHTRDGLVVGWSKSLSRQQLNVEVWQIVIKGQKPTDLRGATDDAIDVLFEWERGEEPPAPQQSDSSRSASSASPR